MNQAEVFDSKSYASSKSLEGENLDGYTAAVEEEANDLDKFQRDKLRREKREEDAREKAKL
jgi:hypothetical protein